MTTLSQLDPFIGFLDDWSYSTSPKNVRLIKRELSQFFNSKDYPSPYFPLAFGSLSIFNLCTLRFQKKFWDRNFTKLALSFNLGKTIYDSIEIKKAIDFPKTHTLDNTKNQNVVLILTATDDYNGAFALRYKTLYLFKQFENANYTIIFHKVSFPKDIASAMQKAVENGNKIKVLWERAHGEQFSMTLSDHPKGDLTILNVKQLKEAFQLLDPDAVILLDSCKTAEGDYNLAQKVAKYSQRKVFAAKKNFNIDGLHIISTNPPEFRFFHFKEEDIPPVFRTSLLSQEDVTAIIDGSKK